MFLSESFFSRKHINRTVSSVRLSLNGTNRSRVLPTIGWFPWTQKPSLLETCPDYFQSEKTVWVAFDNISSPRGRVHSQDK